jgi:hypothetical protein
VSVAVRDVASYETVPGTEPPGPLSVTVEGLRLGAYMARENVACSVVAIATLVAPAVGEVVAVGAAGAVAAVVKLQDWVPASAVPSVDVMLGVRVAV